jgi:hypothetical protein
MAYLEHVRNISIGTPWPNAVGLKLGTYWSTIRGLDILNRCAAGAPTRDVQTQILSKGFTSNVHAIEELYIVGCGARKRRWLISICSLELMKKLL